MFLQYMGRYISEALVTYHHYHLSLIPSSWGQLKAFKRNASTLGRHEKTLHSKSKAHNMDHLKSISQYAPLKLATSLTQCAQIWYDMAGTCHRYDRDAKFTQKVKYWIRDNIIHHLF